MAARSSPRVEEILARLTVDEKAALSLGSDAWHTTPLPDHGVGRVKVTDGPTGARGDGASGATATCFPVGVALGATWDTDLVHEIGAALAEEAKTKAAQVLLGPTVNLQRTPIGGRNFECYSEDPMLTARLAVAFVSGVQEGGVGTCIKHLVGNDVEFDRHEVSADMDDKTLREVALLPFELAVRDADPWSVMAAYNRLNGETCTAHRRLLTDILKHEWGWRGAVISDWGAVKDTAATVNAGCDLEMPGPFGFLGSQVAEAVRAGDVDESQLDDLARRMLLLAERAGRLGNTDEPREQSVDDPGRRALARRAAAASMVLLKNDGALPIAPGAVRSLALIGPNVAGFMIQGGGSSQVSPHARIVGPLEALRDTFGGDVEIVHEEGSRSEKFVPAVPDDHWAGAADEVRGRRAAPSTFTIARRRDDGPVLVEMFNGTELDGEPAWTYRADGMSTAWFGRLRRLGGDDYSGRLTGRYVPDVSGPHTVGLSAVGRGRVFVDGTEVVDNWTSPEPGDTFFANGSAEVRGTVELAAGTPIEVVVEFAKDSAAEMGGVRIGIAPPEPADLIERAVTAARGADAAVVIVGTSAEWETEGNDRATMALPGRQAELLSAVAAVNPRTVVAINAGSPVEMPWIDAVGAVLQVWFGGEEMGPALAEVISGRREPGGRLPHTIPVRLEDHPAADCYPGIDGHLPYREETLCGHRWYDANAIEPRFPFGHGLSYATFEWGEATVEPAALDAARPLCTVDIELTNTSAVEGSEVVQVYVSAPGGAAPRELKAFRKVTVAPGQTGTATLDLDRDAFRQWDATTSRWTLAPGRYTIGVGASSRDLRAELVVDIKG